jgi:hypothetical protein
MADLPNTVNPCKLKVGITKCSNTIKTN